MAEKLSVIIDNVGDNKVLRAFQRLLPNIQGVDVATGGRTTVRASGQLQIRNSRNNKADKTWQMVTLTY